MLRLPCDCGCSGGARPNEGTFYRASVASYDTKAPPVIGELRLIMDTPTIDAYQAIDDNTILIAVRGTYSVGDVMADATLGANALRFSPRYRQDLNAVQELLKQRPPAEFEYYLTGHSLGGAIVRQLKRDFPFFKDAVLYNGAFQPYDLINQQSQSVASRYINTDPLYNLGGRFFANKIVIPPMRQKKQGFFRRFFTFPVRSIKGHSLENFAQLYGGASALKLPSK